MPSLRSTWLLAVVALAACTSPAEQTQTTCEELQARSCPAGCASTSACTDLWLAAAELDPEDLIESCVGTCPRNTCASDTFFDCACYAECMRGGSSELQEAILDAVRCDLGGVPMECVAM